MQLRTHAPPHKHKNGLSVMLSSEPSSAAMQLAVLGLTDFVFVLICSQLLPPSLWWQAAASSVRAAVGLTVVGTAVPLWLVAVTVVGLMAARLEGRVAASTLALVVCPCLEEAFFRGAVMAVDMWLPARVAVSTVWFVSAHDFAEPLSRGVRAVVYALVWEQWGLPAACAAHVAVNVAKRVMAERQLS
jgi:hypothetical protein